jgi:signal transduction histidine kinase
VAGIDLSTGVVCLALAPRQAAPGGSLRALGAVSIVAAGSTGLLCAVDQDGCAAPATAADQALVLATISAVLPLAWLVVTAWSHQQDEDRLTVAVFHLLVAALFALNRYDALVADGTISPPGSILVQPLVLPALITGWGVLHRRHGRTRLAEHEALGAAGERDRIARELHDSVSQTLYSVAMVADGLLRAVDDDPAAARRHASQIRSMTLTALGDLRVLLLELRQSRLDVGPLGVLLQRMASGTDGLVRVELDVGGEPDPPAAVRIAAHRIALQAVANARRHAAPTAIAVRLRQRGGGLVLTVRDDGAGFDPTAVPPGRHGLAIMRERAEGVGGDLGIDSAPGAGTVVRFAWRTVALPATQVVRR